MLILAAFDVVDLFWAWRETQVSAYSWFPRFDNQPIQTECLLTFFGVQNGNTNHEQEARDLSMNQLNLRFNVSLAIDPNIVMLVSI